MQSLPHTIQASTGAGQPTLLLLERLQVCMEDSMLTRCAAGLQDPHPALRYLCWLDAPAVMGLLRQALAGWDALETGAQACRNSACLPESLWPLYRMTCTAGVGEVGYCLPAEVLAAMPAVQTWLRWRPRLPARLLQAAPSGLSRRQALCQPVNRPAAHQCFCRPAEVVHAPVCWLLHLTATCCLLVVPACLQAVVDAVVVLLESGAFDTTTTTTSTAASAHAVSSEAGAAGTAPAAETAALQFLAAHLAANRAVASGGILLRVLQHLAAIGATAAADMLPAEREAVFCDVVTAAGSSMRPPDLQQVDAGGAAGPRLCCCSHALLPCS